MSVLPLLRAGTAAAHQRLEAVMALDSPSLDAARYGQALQVLHAAREGWEPELQALFPGEAGPHRDWLLADLAVLRLEPLPPEAGLSPSRAAGWGVRYVLEGSALGGRVIARQAEGLGFTAGHGARYFAGRGAETGAHWRGFLLLLEEAGRVEAAEEMLRGACRAFEALEKRAVAVMGPARSLVGA